MCKKSLSLLPVKTLEMEGVTAWAKLCLIIFQRQLGMVLHGQHWQNVAAKLNTFKDYKRLDEMFGWLQDAELKLEPARCELLKPKHVA